MRAETLQGATWWWFICIQCWWVVDTSGGCVDGNHSSCDLWVSLCHPMPGVPHKAGTAKGCSAVTTHFWAQTPGLHAMSHPIMSHPVMSRHSGPKSTSAVCDNCWSEPVGRQMFVFVFTCIYLCMCTSSDTFASNLIKNLFARH